MKTRNVRPPKVQDSFRLDPGLLLRVKTVSRKNGWTKTWVIETALRRVLPEMEKVQPFLRADLLLDGFAV